MSSYDQNLLDEAPRATRAQLQEGYNVDLLEQPPRRTPSVRTPPSQTPHPAPVTVPLTPAFAETGSGEKFGPPAHTSAAPKPRTSFWRSRNGIITIVLIVLIVVGAVVGGAVGGTIKKSTDNTVDTTGTNSSVSGQTATGAADNSTASASPANIGSGTNRPAGFTTGVSGTTSLSQNTVQPAAPTPNVMP